MKHYIFITFIFCLSFMMNNEAMQDKSIRGEKHCFADSSSCTIRAFVQKDPSLCKKLFGFASPNKLEECWAGSITYNTLHCNSKKKGYISDLYVDIHSRRSGVGTLLFKSALQDLKEKGCAKVYWNSTDMGIPFYLKNGAMKCNEQNDMKIRVRERNFEEKLTKFLKKNGMHFLKNDLFE